MDDGADDAVPDGDGVTYRVSAYVTTFDDTITFALVSNGNLWSAEERAILNLCRPGTLSEGARLILSRLSLRRPKWIKSNSISHYVPYHQKPGQNVEGEFHASLDSLERHSFLEYVNAKSPFETAYEAVESSFLLDDLLILYKKLTTQKNVTNGNSKPLNKEGLLEAISLTATAEDQSADPASAAQVSAPVPGKSLCVALCTSLSLTLMCVFWCDPPCM
jgi:hypothetical protein